MSAMTGASASSLAALPESLLHAILARVPGRDAARAMSACRALAVAVRSMPEIALFLDINSAPAAPAKPSGRATKRQRGAAGALRTWCWSCISVRALTRQCRCCGGATRA